MTNTSKEVSDICNFIDEQFVKEMITDRQNDVPDKKDNSWTTVYENSVINKDINKTSLVKWKSQLHQFDISIIENFCDQKMFNKFYKKTSRKVTLFYYLKYFYLKFNYYLKQFFFGNIK